jgi:hypothetical protein
MKKLFLFSSVLLFTSCFLACEKHASTAPDARQDLINASKDTTAGNFYYASREYDGQVVHTLTSKATENLIRPTEGSVSLRYTSIRGSKGDSATHYKTELITKGKMSSLVVTDLSTGKEFWRKDLPFDIPGLDTLPPLTTAGFDSIEECIKDFNCKHKGELQCKANETCENQFAGITCCLTNGQCFSIHFIITPNNWRCRFKDLIPDLDGIVLSRD